MTAFALPLKTVTSAMLLEMGACVYSVQVFVKLFGDEAEVNAENVRKAIDGHLLVSWLVMRLNTDAMTDLVHELNQIYSDFGLYYDRKLSYHDAFETMSQNRAEAFLRALGWGQKEVSDAVHDRC